MRYTLWIVTLLTLFHLAACTDETHEEGDGGIDTEQDGGSDNVAICPGDGPFPVRPQGWGLLTHCNGVPPDYAKLFEPAVVHRFDITVSPENHAAAMADLDAKLSGGGPDDDVLTPIFVPVTVQFEGVTWWNVAMRYKGNSSLKNAWQRGIRKLAIRLNFGLFGNDEGYLEVLNQHFYGFAKMTFSNAFDDPSLIRDKLTADIFREGGVPTARGAFARIFVDFGEGPTYFGLYTMIEDPSDQMPGDQFADATGNLYKPEGTGAMWGSFVAADFPRKTNLFSDWSDVQAAFAALHADKTDPALWRTNLEATFHVGSFLKFLAINQAMQNWDSYGFMAHNYYIYGDPSDGGRLFWFPWDFNLAMMPKIVDGKDTGSILLDEIGEEWPLIRFLLDDPVYNETYKAELQAALQGSFAIPNVYAKMDTFHQLIAPYVVGPEGESGVYTFLGTPEEFTTSLDKGENALKPHVAARHEAVKAALGI